MNEVTPPPGGEIEFPLPAAILGDSKKLLDSYEDVLRRTSAFAVEVADKVRANPHSVSGLIHEFATATAWVFQRWNLEILYLLSLTPELRYSQIRDALSGISGRSLSLKLDEIEQNGLILRRVSGDKPPHVLYAITERGRRLSHLSFPLVLHVNMDRGLRAKLLGDAAAATKAPRGSSD